MPGFLNQLKKTQRSAPGLFLDKQLRLERLQELATHIQMLQQLLGR